MDDELKDLFFDAIEHFPLEQRDTAQRWLEESGLGESCGAANGRHGGGVTGRAQLIGSRELVRRCVSRSQIERDKPRGVLARTPPTAACRVVSMTKTTVEMLDLFARVCAIEQAGQDETWEVDGGRRREYFDLQIELHRLLGRQIWETRRFSTWPARACCVRCCRVEERAGIAE